MAVSLGMFAAPKITSSVNIEGVGTRTWLLAAIWRCCRGPHEPNDLICWGLGDYRPSVGCTALVVVVAVGCSPVGTLGGDVAVFQPSHC